MKLKLLRKKYTWLGGGFFMFCLLIGSDLKSATEQGPALAPRQNVPVANVELVEVVKAMYGNMDVTAQLRQMLKNNRAIQFNGNKGEMNNLFVQPEPNQDLFIDVKMGKTGRVMRYKIPSGQAFWLGDASVRPPLLGNSAATGTSTVGVQATKSHTETTTVAVPQAAPIAPTEKKKVSWAPEISQTKTFTRSDGLDGASHTQSTMSQTETTTQAAPASPSKRGSVFSDIADFAVAAAGAQATTPQAGTAAVAVPQATAQGANQASVAQPPTAEPRAATTQGGKAQSSQGIARRTPSGAPLESTHHSIVKYDARAEKPLSEQQKRKVKEASRTARKK